MSASLRMWLSISQLVLVFILFCSLVMTAVLAGPIIETRFFPVVNKLTITDLTQDAEGYSVFNAEFTKLRPCKYLNIGWYDKLTGDRITTRLGRSTTDDVGITRPPGFTRTGPWTVEISNKELLNNSYAILLHDCHPMWVSVTNFYP